MDINPVWDRELERMGREAVIARLKETGSGPGAEFRLWVPHPSRGYVEEWLRRTAAEDAPAAAKAASETKATETRRYLINVWLAVAGIVAAIQIAVWPAPWLAVLRWFR